MFSKSLLKAVRNKQFYFWSFLFPFALMCLFRVAFAGIYDQEICIDPIKVAVVADDEGMLGDYFIETVEALSEGDEPLLIYVDDVKTIEEAEALFAEETTVDDQVINAYFHVTEDDIEIVVDKVFYAGRDEAHIVVLRQLTDTFLNQYHLIYEAAFTNPEMIPSLVEELSSDIEYTAYESNVYKNDIDTYDWYFYTTIVMGMMFNFQVGIELVTSVRADASEVAKRINISPKRKISIVASEVIANLIPCSVITAILFLIAKFVMGIPMTSEVGNIALFIVTGNFFTIAFGSFIAMLQKGSTKDRSNKSWGFIMLLVFLSGEMYNQMPAILEKNAPFLNDINPATIMNFALFDLTYANDLSDFYVAMAKILVAAIVLMVLSAVYMRRNSYASL